MYDYSWVEFDFHGLFHFVVETTVDISGAEHLVVAWFISFLLSFFFSFFFILFLSQCTYRSRFSWQTNEVGEWRNYLRTRYSLESNSLITGTRLRFGFTSDRPKFRILLDTGFNFLLVMDPLFKIYVPWAGREPTIPACQPHEKRWGRQKNTAKTLLVYDWRWRWTCRTAPYVGAVVDK